MLARVTRGMACTLFACTLTSAAYPVTSIVSECTASYSVPYATTSTMELRSNSVRVEINASLDFSLEGETTLDLPQGSYATFDHALRNNSSDAQQLVIGSYYQGGQSFLLDNMDMMRNEASGAETISSRKIIPGKPFWMKPGEVIFFNVSGDIPEKVEAGAWTAFAVNAARADASAIIARVDRVKVRHRTPGTGMFVEKTVSRPEAEVGQTVDYTLRIKNVSDASFPQTWVKDVMPTGFVYVPGTLTVNGIKRPDLKVEKNTFLIDVSRIPETNVCVIKYRVHIGATALGGSGVNRAQAFVTGYKSNIAEAAVHVTEGAFNSKGFVVGRVFCDKNKNGRPDPGEIGVPGVRLFLEDGTSVTTDGDGKYSFYGLRPITHVIKIDSSTLPEGAVANVTSQDQAGSRTSRFLKLQRFQLQKANFVLDFDDETIAEIETRKAFLHPDEIEIAREVRAHFSADGSLGPISDPKALPSAGTIKPIEEPAIDTGLKAKLSNNLPKPKIVAARVEDAAGLDDSASSEPVDLFKDPALAALDSKLGFLAITDGAVLLTTLTNIRVKGPLGAKFALAVNGEIIGEDRVGTKASVPDRQAEMWEFVGLTLRPGKNRIRVTMFDPFGNVRGTETITLTAPGDLAYIKAISLKEKAVADGVTPALIQLELIDAMNTLVTTRTPITLETSLGQFRAEDLDPATPGTQIFIEGGKAVIALIPPSEPGESLVSIRSGLIKQEVEVAFLPNLRPLVAVGVVEGTLHLGAGARSGILPAGSRNAFEEELIGLSASSQDGKLGASGRVAFFLKGKVRGDYLLTTAYDSDKPTQERLFRDIQPGEFYPVYGDSSVRGYDAQSTGKLYVRIDKNRSYLLIGDFTTQNLASDENDSRALGNYQRSLTGLREHYETKRLRANTWISNDSTRQVVKEVPAKGVSGPYVFNVPGIRENSERIEILVHDRDQPSRILEVRPQTRFYDYEFDPFTGELLFKAPIPSLDQNLNPISIRLTCELQTGGDKFWTYGADAEAKVAKGTTVSGGIIRNEDPQNVFQLASVGASVKVSEKTTVTGEVAQSTSQLKGAGRAERVDLKHQDTKLNAHAFVGRAEESFENPASILLPGRVEGGLELNYKLATSTSLRAKGIISHDLAAAARREGILLEIERTLGRWKLDIGTRLAEQTGARGSRVARQDTTVESVRTKITAPVPKLKSASAYLEYEQDIRDSNKQLAAAGFDYQLKSNGRLYARHELISSLGGPFELNEDQRRHNTVVGLENEYMKDGHTFNEYRSSNEINGREAEAATGLRNLWRISETLHARTSFEQVTPFAGNERNRATAVTGAIEYAPKANWRADSRLEYRRSFSSDTILSIVGYARQIDRDWTFLGKTVVLLTESKRESGRHAVQSRVQAGFAWRPQNNDRWNALGKYELKYETDTRTSAAFNERIAHVLTSDLNYQPFDPLTLTSHFAGKFVDERELASPDLNAIAYLVGGSARWDLPRGFLLGLNAYALLDHSTRQRRFAIGPELGFNVAKNFEIGVGYNLTGFRDRDLSADETTAKGLFIRFRLKFDETARFTGKKTEKT